MILRRRFAVWQFRVDATPELLEAYAQWRNSLSGDSHLPDPHSGPHGRIHADKDDLVEGGISTVIKL